MNTYSIYADDGTYLFDIHADSEIEAIAEAKKSDKRAYDAEYVSRGSER